MQQVGAKADQPQVGQRFPFEELPDDAVIKQDRNQADRPEATVKQVIAMKVCIVNTSIYSHSPDSRYRQQNRQQRNGANDSREPGDTRIVCSDPLYYDGRQTTQQKNRQIRQ